MWQTPVTINNPFDRSGENRPLVLRLVDLAEERSLLDRLLEKTEDARAKAPRWKTALALETLIHCRAGRFDQVRALVRRAIDSVQTDERDIVANGKFLVCWTLGRSSRILQPLATSPLMHTWPACLNRTPCSSFGCWWRPNDGR